MSDDRAGTVGTEAVTASRHTVPVTSRPDDAGPVGRASRLLPFVPAVVVLVILGSLVVNGARPLDNTDTYFHLRFGEEFLNGWSLRHPGSVSTFATRQWVPTQWLSEIAMAKVEGWFGLAGLAFLSGLLEIALFVVLYAVARDQASPLVAAPLTGVALFAMQEGLSMRPQMISYLMVAVVTAAWLRTRHDGRVRWWLILLTYLWAMLHGTWPLALVIGLVAVVGLALDRAPRRVVLRSAVVPVASAVACALTPIGPALYTAVVAVGARTSYFYEWQPPDYTQPSTLTLAALLALTAVAMWKRPHNSWTEILLLVLTGALAVYTVRTVSVAAAMVVPVAAGPLQELLGRRTPVGRREVGLVAGAVLAALVALGVAVPHTADEPMAQPSWLGPAMNALPPGTKVLNDWNLGGYLMWRYPQLDLMMSGYGDTFTTAELDRNTGLLELDAGWDGSLRDSGARVAVLRSYARLTYALIHQYHWRVVHSSPSLVMLRAPSSWVAYSTPAASFADDEPSGT
jgi:hypothetical protein